MTAWLAARDLTLMLGGRAVVEAASLELWRGEWVAIVGPNGAGKSSLLSLLAGWRVPTAGALNCDGQPMAALAPRERARRIAWLGPSAEAEGEIAAIEVVRLGRLPWFGLLGVPSAADEAAVRAAMAETECEAFADRRLSELSAGERQRVLLARVLAAQSPTMLLDEPTAHLDAPHQMALLRSVEQRARNGAAVAVVLHDLTLAMAADRVLVMRAGAVVAGGAPADPALRAAVQAVFNDAYTIELVQGRWVAVPRWPAPTMPP